MNRGERLAVSINHLEPARNRSTVPGGGNRRSAIIQASRMRVLQLLRAECISLLPSCGPRYGLRIGLSDGSEHVRWLGFRAVRQCDVVGER